MVMDEKHNPKSWSELPRDLLNLVFERLGFTDFQRAKSVCSSWHSGSTQSVPKNQTPWLIIFPIDNNNNSCKLFNPNEEDKLYQTQDLVIEFEESDCVATYGSWLLMKDPRFNLYIMNLFSHERINLPPVESQLGTTMIERVIDNEFNISGVTLTGINIRSPVFWIDEKTKDYVVIWALGKSCVVYSRKGDNLWNQMPKQLSCCCQMVYKDHKLYFSSFTDFFAILDFTGQVPRQTNQCLKLVRRNEYMLLPPVFKWNVSEIKLVVTVRGDVIKVVKLERRSSTRVKFQVYKVYNSSSSRFITNDVRVYSLGDEEAILYDLGITVIANSIDGFNRNDIYFIDSYDNNMSDVLIFNMETKKTKRTKVPLSEFDCSFPKPRWFLPSMFTS